MKVLEKGQFRYTFECGECRAILMATENDFKTRDGSVTSNGMTGGITEFICECLECSTIHVGDSSKIPADVRARIAAKKLVYTPRQRQHPKDLIG